MLFYRLRLHRAAGSPPSTDSPVETAQNTTREIGKVSKNIALPLGVVPPPPLRRETVTLELASTLKELIGRGQCRLFDFVVSWQKRTISSSFAQCENSASVRTLARWQIEPTETCFPPPFRPHPVVGPDDSGSAAAGGLRWTVGGRTIRGGHMARTFCRARLSASLNSDAS